MHKEFQDQNMRKKKIKKNISFYRKGKKKNLQTRLPSNLPDRCLRSAAARPFESRRRCCLGRCSHRMGPKRRAGRRSERSLVLGALALF